MGAKYINPLLNIHEGGKYKKMIYINSYTFDTSINTLNGIDGIALRAYSVRKLNRLYTGYCMRVRNVSSVEVDIPFTDTNEINTAILSSHLAGGVGRVTIWYDQIGSNNLTNAVTNQPYIKLNAIGSKPSIWTNDASGFYLDMPNISTYTGGLSVTVLIKKGTQTNPYATVLGGSEFVNGVVMSYDIASNDSILYHQGTAYNNGVELSGSTDTSQVGYRTYTLNNIGQSWTSGRLFSRNPVQSQFCGEITEFIVWKNDLYNRLDAEDNIRTYYGHY